MNYNETHPNPPCEGGNETHPDPPCEGGERELKGVSINFLIINY